jgi:type I restriction enzyme S subunit
MAGEWPETPLADLTEPDTPVTYGVVKPGDEDPDGVLFIRGGDIANGRVLTGQLRTISKEISNQYKRTLLRGGELVMSLVGNPGQVAIVTESLRGANIARQAALIRLRRDVDSRFVMYFLGSRIGQDPCVFNQPNHNLAISRPRKAALGRSSAIPPLGR